MNAIGWYKIRWLPRNIVALVQEIVLGSLQIESNSKEVAVEIRHHCLKIGVRENLQYK